MSGSTAVEDAHTHGAAAQHPPDGSFGSLKDWMDLDDLLPAPSVHEPLPSMLHLVPISLADVENAAALPSTAADAALSAHAAELAGIRESTALTLELHGGELDYDCRRKKDDRNNRVTSAIDKFSSENNDFVLADCNGVDLIHEDIRFVLLDDQGGAVPASPLPPAQIHEQLHLLDLDHPSMEHGDSRRKQHPMLIMVPVESEAEYCKHSELQSAFDTATLDPTSRLAHSTAETTAAATTADGSLNHPPIKHDNHSAKDKPRKRNHQGGISPTRAILKAATHPTSGKPEPDLAPLFASADVQDFSRAKKLKTSGPLARHPSQSFSCIHPRIGSSASPDPRALPRRCETATSPTGRVAGQEIGLCVTSTVASQSRGAPSRPQESSAAHVGIVAYSVPPAVVNAAGSSVFDAMSMSLAEKRRIESARFPSAVLTSLAGTTSAEVRRMSDEQRQLVLFKRKLRNRESARRSRQKRQATLNELQDDVDELAMTTDRVLDLALILRDENEALRKQLERAQAELRHVCSVPANSSVKLSAHDTLPGRPSSRTALPAADAAKLGG